MFTTSKGVYFQLGQAIQNLNMKFNLNELSMGMSGDYLEAIKNNATYVRVGSKIFGSRT